jgi:hypothetical protein
MFLTEFPPDALRAGPDSVLRALISCPGLAEPLAFTVAPHLQLINYRGCFCRFVGI